MIEVAVSFWNLFKKTSETVASYLLFEDNDFILLEDNSKILLQR